MRDTALDMLDLLTMHRALSRNDAYPLMSVTADFGVTQVVDGRQGVYVRIGRDLFPSWNSANPRADLTDIRTNTRPCPQPGTAR